MTISLPVILIFHSKTKCEAKGLTNRYITTIPANKSRRESYLYFILSSSAIFIKHRFSCFINLSEACLETSGITNIQYASTGSMSLLFILSLSASVSELRGFYSRKTTLETVMESTGKKIQTTYCQCSSVYFVSSQTRAPFTLNQN